MAIVPAFLLIFCLALFGCHELLPYEPGASDAASDQLTLDAGVAQEGGGNEQGTADLGPRDSAADQKVAPDQGPPDQGPPDFPTLCTKGCSTLGCNMKLGRCNRVPATNGQAVISSEFDKIAVAAGGIVLKGAAVINTGTGEITDDGVTVRSVASPNGTYWSAAAQGTSKKLSLFIVKSLTVSAGARVAVVGNLPLALYSTGDVTIDGTITTNTTSSAESAAGGFSGGTQNNQDGAACQTASGLGAGKGGNYACNYGTGGGGGGHLASGGAGGSNNPTGGTTTTCGGGGGGAQVGSGALVPLLGGCGGGHGGGAASEKGGIGGGGGGAIQITVNGTLTIGKTGRISMPGAGGGAGQAKHGGGGGGGAGGAILLEAVKIDLTSGAFLAANGGGGGSGGGKVSADADPGSPGSDDATPAPGGAHNSPQYFGSGAAGGASTAVGGQSPSTASQYSAGGGGGAAGRIRCNTSTGSPCKGSASPDPTSSSTMTPW